MIEDQSEGQRKKVIEKLIWEFPKFRGTLSGGPHKKAYNILGSILGVPLFWETMGSVGLRAQSVMWCLNQLTSRSYRKGLQRV